MHFLFDALPESALGGVLSLLILGIGNELCGDDGIGPLVAREVARQAPALSVRITRGEGLELFVLWAGFDHVILVDAVFSGAAPGTLHRLDVGTSGVPAALLGRSTHTLSLGEALELARALDQLPPVVVVYGIEGGCFQRGTGITPAVAAAVPVAVEGVLKEALKLERF